MYEAKPVVIQYPSPYLQPSFMVVLLFGGLLSCFGSDHDFPALI